jgi:hypothetical protein
MNKQKDEKEASLNFVNIARKENLTDYVLADLDTRIKKDRAVKLSIFFTGLSSFMNDPINLFLKGESGSGKTFNTTETLKYFPEDSILFLGGMSPKALIHSRGVLLNKNGEEIDLDFHPAKPSKNEYETEEDYKKAVQNYQEQLKDRREEMRESYTLIDLSHKILVFLENPDFDTLLMLRPLLSHDKERIEYQFVEKTGKGLLQTRKVILKGWPATVFCTTDNKYVEELATRSFTATPESSELKILAANVLTNMKVSFPWQYMEETQAFRTITKLIQRLQEQALECSIDVLVPFLLYELFPKEITRDMRDFQHFTQFLKTITLLHYFQRPYMKLNGSKMLVATLEDVTRTLSIYREIFETTRTGTEKQTLDFYHQIVKTRDSWYLKNLTEEYNQKFKRKLSEDSIRVKLERLDKIGYVNSQQDDVDKRRKLYVPLKKGEEKGENGLKTDSQQDLEAKLKKSFETWKNNITGKLAFYYYKNISEKAWGESEISFAELEQLVTEGQKTFSSNSEGNNPRLISKEESNFKPETSPETKREAKTQPFSDNSTEGLGNLIPCPECKARGKTTLFASDADLAAHAKTFHGQGQEYVS